LAETLLTHSEIKLLEVATGTDVRGSAEYNLDLSKRRAESVVQFLIDHGVDKSRLVSVGYGETQLREQNCETEECHEKNRYSQFTILTQE
jgi:outer membrane protein OmpA-like peptidoglycan-associated protein